MARMSGVIGATDNNANDGSKACSDLRNGDRGVIRLFRATLTGGFRDDRDVEARGE